MHELLRHMKALSDETRLRLVTLLSRFELNVGEIVQILDMGQSRISRHLKILAEAGLVQARRDGLWTFYTTREDGTGGIFLDALTPFLQVQNTEESFTNQDRAAAQRLISERTLRTRRFFDSVAEQWPDLSRELLGDVDLGQTIEDFLGTCGTAADLGCGTGELLPVLAGHADRVIGVDHSAQMLEAAQKRLGSNPGIDLRIGQLEHLPLRDNEANCALICMALHHLSTPADGLAEAARVLSPGGSLLIADLAQHEREDLRERHGDHWLGFSTQALKSLLSKAGFIAIREEQRIPLESGLELVLTKALKPNKNSPVPAGHPL